ncbi:hypothetical protein MMYC01_210418 [Madurella mycetomatis]|uniref:Uncharacterized protein n=1 Tax=Madurella mycetomatis TaxID=100816 RepID=A0A175VR34_9PEZI|nr:hypothetical protein MMYC01_210418 [Madurella mycetomatis]
MPPPTITSCIGSPTFDPAKAVHDAETHQRAIQLLRDENNVEKAIRTWFGIPEGEDKYVYRAIVGIRLGQVQKVVEGDVVRRGLEMADGGVEFVYGNGENRLRWYQCPEAPSDIVAYTSIFQSATNTASTLKSFLSNARKSSLRQRAASHLVAKRFFLPSHPLTPVLSSIPRCKQPPALNPALDFWEWTCQLLAWCGPLREGQGDGGGGGKSHQDGGGAGESRNEGLKVSGNDAGRQAATGQKRGAGWGLQSGSHHLLPVMMHHFGCVVPTHESLMIIKTLAQGEGGKKGPNKKGHKKVADIGSGNGYWAMMLRTYGVEVDAVDSMMSEWLVLSLPPSLTQNAIHTYLRVLTATRRRTTWIPDTIVQTGTGYLAAHPNHDGLVLLLVYPVVGGKLTSTVEGSFTRDLVAAYKGDTLVVVGTQNHNGYTSFSNMTMDEYMGREHAGEWVKTVQIAMPSFAGKDEAMFVFQRLPRGKEKPAGSVPWE